MPKELYLILGAIVVVVLLVVYLLGIFDGTSDDISDLPGSDEEYAMRGGPTPRDSAPFGHLGSPPAAPPPPLPEGARDEGRLEEGPRQMLRNRGVNRVTMHMFDS